MMRHLWIPVFLIIGILVGIFGYRWYLSSPYYTLYQVKSAIKDHDWEKFCKYVDVNKASTGLARDMAKITEKALDTKEMPELLSKGLFALVVIKMRSSIKNDTKSWVMGQDQGKGVLGSILPERDSAKDGKVKISLTKVTSDDDRAVAFVDLESKEDKLELKLEMQKIERRWRIIKIANTLEIVKEVAEERGGRQ
ncbi:MAG: DUF2939 domain-containing protein [Thermodesulfobacteriota bacterium]|nr:DUF2939 domain-containing protein [Thermodesulfobacteriota bacterium]